MSMKLMMAMAAAFGAIAVNAAEVSLLHTVKWVRPCDKDQIVWHPDSEAKEVTMIQRKDSKREAGIGCDFIDLSQFRDKDVELVLVMDGENVVRGQRQTNRWPGDQAKPGPRDFTPVTYHWETKFAAYANWFTPQVSDFPEGTYKDHEVVISFYYPATADKFGMSIRACCESGTVTYKKVVVREAAKKYMDQFLKVPDDFKCEYTDKVLKNKNLRGIVAGDGHKLEDFEKIRGWGCNLVRFWVGKPADLSKTDALLPELDRLGIKIILTPAVPGPRIKGNAYKLFNDEELYNRYIANWKRIAEHYKGDERIFAFDLMNEPFQPLRSDPEDKYNFLVVQYEAAKAIRAIDPDRVLIASGTGGGSPGDYNACNMRPLPMKDVIYQMHFYAPFFLTHAGLYGTKLDLEHPYPGIKKRNTVWTKKEVAKVMDYTTWFEKRWGAQIYVGEFSCMSIQPGSAQWLEDVADLIEQHGWIWTFHSYGEFYGWNLEWKRDETTNKPVKVKPGETTDRLEIMKKYWAKNWK